VIEGGLALSVPEPSLDLSSLFNARLSGRGKSSASNIESMPVLVVIPGRIWLMPAFNDAGKSPTGGFLGTVRRHEYTGRPDIALAANNSNPSGSRTLLSFAATAFTSTPSPTTSG